MALHFFDSEKFDCHKLFVDNLKFCIRFIVTWEYLLVLPN